MSINFPGVSELLGSVVGGAISSFGSTVSPFPFGGGGAQSAAYPNPANIGNTIGSTLGTQANQYLMNVPQKFLPNIFKNSVLGPFAQQMWNNLFAAGLVGTMDQMLQRGDPNLAIDWSIQMPMISGFGSVVDISQYVESINLSTLSIETTDFTRAGRTVHYAAGRSCGPVTVEFYEDNRLTSSQYIDAWRKLVALPNGTFNYPSQYKQQIIVSVLDSRYQFIGSLVLIGCFPTTPAQYPYRSDHSERIRLSQEFNTDHVAFIGNSLTNNQYGGSNSSIAFGANTVINNSLDTRFSGNGVSLANIA